MFEGLVATDSISFILVFLEGIISFFSPCVIPLIPVYMSYLAGNAKKEEDGIITYGRKKVFFHTLFFILGISFAFFILGMSFTALGKFFNTNKMLFTRVGGILIIILGLFQLGIFDLSFLQRERKIHINLANKNVNPLMALIMGFTFSFAWTPCVGPALSSVLIMASGAKTGLLGNMLVLVYALGFVLPFLLLGLFTTQVLDFLRKRKKLLKYTIKAGGIILILMGIMTFTGWMNGISSYLNSFTVNRQKNEADYNENHTENDSGEDTSLGNDNTLNNSDDSNQKNNSTAKDNTSKTDVNTEEDTSLPDESTQDTDKNSDNTENEEKPEYPPAYDFTLTDQYGNTHTLSDYKGKVVFLNFWASWCGPCKKEMPDIEELYQKYNLNQDEVVFLGVANPKSKDYPHNSDEEKDEILEFLDENGYKFPTVFDETGEILMNYYITAFPTTFMINKEGNVMGYIPGMMTKDIMESVIEQTLESTN
ncbi:cytochrome c biogenesis protein CcdA [Anaerocolumna aminovalerica]|uniref:Cytochrome c-type biogenesis protein n=1 Tax=Anaerocolumna aminovalerica TaxID=1527 RepID=A0A1I5HWH2_9FIRM|nr:cytochrome c biogenesis protein CcdA [Anaerocolumna aminovalerica]SFO52698.1 cytochrome c-type biogenesis protein [Anaerocolumna aminovalerica]